MAIFLVIIYLCMIYYLGDYLVWGLLVFTSLFTAIVAALIWLKGEEMADNGWDDTAWAAKLVAIIMIAVDVVFCVMMCCLYKRIQLSIEILQEAAKAFWELKE